MEVEFQNKQELMSIVKDDSKLSESIAAMGCEANTDTISAIRNFFSGETKFDSFREMCVQAYGDLEKSDYWQSINHPKDKGFDVSKIYIALPDFRGGRCFHDMGHNEDVVSLSPLSFALNFSKYGLDKPQDQQAYIKAVLAHEFTHADQYNRDGVEAPQGYLPGEEVKREEIKKEKGKEPSWLQESLHEGECRATAMTITLKDGDSLQVQKAVAQQQCLYNENVAERDLPRDYNEALRHAFYMYDAAATSPNRQGDKNYVSSNAAAHNMVMQLREYEHGYDEQRISKQQLTKIVTSAKNVSKALDMERKHLQSLSCGSIKDNKVSPVINNEYSKKVLPPQSQR